MISQMTAWEKSKGIKFLKQIGLKKDFVVLDFGARVGHYTIPAARLVGTKGKVYALDKDQAALNDLKNKAKYLSLKNIEIVKSNDEIELDFPDDYFDAVLLYDILHYFDTDQRRILLTEIQNRLRQKGVLSIYPKHIAEDYPMMELKNITRQELIKEIEGCGYKFFKKICDTISHDDFLNYACVINFVKKKIKL